MIRFNEAASGRSRKRVFELACHGEIRRFNEAASGRSRKPPDRTRPQILSPGFNEAASGRSRKPPVVAVVPVTVEVASMRPRAVARGNAQYPAIHYLTC